MENMIETKDVIQSFPIAGGKELVVLKNINIQIPTGKLTMLRGRSGSGKTTLMNLLSALDYPKSGEILFEGKPIQDLPEHDREQMRKTQIGFVFQSVALTRRIQRGQEKADGRMSEISWSRKPYASYAAGTFRW